MNKVTAQEVVTAFNSRSDLGRVVINPLSQHPLELHRTMGMNFCCGRAYLTEESFQKHQTEVTEHGKLVDLTKIRRALNDRSSIAFWRSRKVKAAKRFSETGEEISEDEEEEDDQEQVDPVSSIPEFEGMPKLKVQRKRPRLYKTCHLCNLSMPGTNIPRHIRTCHNPQHQFKCSFCTCRFVVPFGRISHESKAHGVRSTRQCIQTANKVKKKLIKPSKIKIAMFTRNLGSLGSSLSAEDEAKCQSQIQRLSNGQFQCAICKKVFRGFRNVRDHMNAHFNVKPWQCELCSHKFAFQSNVGRHVKNCHTGNSEFMCTHGCGCTMNSAASLRTHVNMNCMLRHKLPDGEVEINTEGKLPPPPALRTKPNSILKQILSKPHSQLASASSRNSVFAQRNQFQHLQVSPGVYRCDKCGKNICGGGNIRDHLNIHAGIRPHQCPKCYMKFSFKNNIKKHLSCAHVPDGQYKCPMQCGCVMGNLNALNSHLNTCKRRFNKRNQGNNPASSPSKMIPRPPPLTRAPTFSSDSSPAEFRCDVCGKVVSSRRNLSNHMLIHTNAKPYTCHMCGFLFRQKHALIVHQKHSHEPSSIYKCPLCTCRFKDLQGLVMHTKIFHEQKPTASSPLSPPKMNQVLNTSTAQSSSPQIKQEIPEANGDFGQDVEKRQELKIIKTKDGRYKCSTCGKILKSLDTLRTHSDIHTGAKNFKCEICGALFRRASTMHSHKKVSHSGGKFKCPLCPCMFQSEHGRYRHQSVYHNHGWKATGSRQRQALSIRRKALKLTKHSAPMRSRPPTQRPTEYQNQNGIIKIGNTIVTPVTKTIPELPLARQRPTPSSSQGSVSTSPKLHLQAPRPSNLKMNTTTSRSSALFQCGHCGLALATLQDLSEHQKAHTLVKPGASTAIDEPFPPSCPICDCKIHNRSHFNNHMQSSHTSGSFLCTLCPCKFEAQRTLSSHYTRFHPEFIQGYKPRSRSRSRGSSSVTLRALKSNSSLEIEERTQPVNAESAIPTPPVRVQPPSITKQERFECEECGKFLLGRYGLQQHLKLHSNDTKTHKCPECGQFFRTASIMGIHIQKSHGSGTFLCTQCPSRFVTPKGLSVHQFVYHKGGRSGLSGGRKTGSQIRKSIKRSSTSMVSNSKIYQMPSTSKLPPRSNSNSTVTQPRASSSPSQRPMKCQLCGKICLGPSNLKEHIMAMHKVSSTHASSMNSHYPHAKTSVPSSSRSTTFSDQTQVPRMQSDFPSEDEGVVPNFEIVNQEDHDDGDEDNNQNSFEIVGYDNFNSYEDPEDVNTVEEATYQGQDLQENYDDFDYENIDDHLEIVHEENNLNFEDDDEDDGMEMEVSDSGDPVRDQQYQNNQTNEGNSFTPIQCRGCNIFFGSRNAFSSHVEAPANKGSTDSYRCPYCCISGIPVDSVATHVNQYHSDNEIEYIESQIYTDFSN